MNEQKWWNPNGTCSPVSAWSAAGGWCVHNGHEFRYLRPMMIEPRALAVEGILDNEQVARIAHAMATLDDDEWLDFVAEFDRELIGKEPDVKP